ncbi:winged helix DNA-binding domain-containing protein [soil metagenome]
MTEVWRARIHAQGLQTRPFASPAETVAHFGGVQSQEYIWSRWALGARINSVTETQVDEALATGAIVRTHVLRPTWHFVTPADLHWLLTATADRVRQINASSNKREGLDAATLDRHAEIIVEALSAEPHLTRKEIAEHLVASGLEVGSGQRLSYIVMHAELHGLIASGPLQGKHHTYRLVSGIASAPPSSSVDEARIRLAQTYVRGHGPSRAEDLAWWSSLSLTQARKALAEADLPLVRLDGEDYYASTEHPALADDSAYLLPPYDEYVSYKHGPSDPGLTDFGLATDRWAGGYVIAAGLIRGNWFRTLNGAGLVVQIRLATDVNSKQRAALRDEAHRFGVFCAGDTRVELSS